MTIEVRQLLIKSQVNPAPQAQAVQASPRQEQERAQLKEEILAECKAWLASRLPDARER
jgi:hypothetical protein